MNSYDLTVVVKPDRVKLFQVELGLGKFSAFEHSSWQELRIEVFWDNSREHRTSVHESRTLIPALLHFPTASGTAARGGSIIDISPTNVRFSRGKLTSSESKQ